MTSTLQSRQKISTRKDARVYSYVRISTKIKKQLKGRGIKRQDDGYLAWCKDNGYTPEPANCFADRGVSAFKGRNVEFGELKAILKLVEEGLIRRGDILVIESLDRLSRDKVNKAVSLLLNIVNEGVIVVTMIDHAVYRDDADPQALMASIIMSVAIFCRANDESRTKSMRKADSWKHKRELAAKGKYHGGNVPQWIRVVGDGYEVIESKAKIMRDIFADYVGSMGLYKLKHKYGISPATIAYWIDNPVVIGTLTVKENGAQIQFKNHYPAIIEKKMYELAQQRRTERYVNRRKGRVGKYTNLFAGLLTDPNGEKPEISSHNGGVRNYTSPGFVIRARYLEEAICFWKLPSKFVRVHNVTEPAEPSNDKALIKIEADIKQIQATMMEESELAVTLLPVLRKLQQQKNRLKVKPKEVRESVGIDLILNLLNDDDNIDSRLRLRDLAHQSIKAIRLTNIDAQNWYVMVSGFVITSDDQKHTFRYAYNTRRNGFIMCDRPNNVTYSTKKDEEERPVAACVMADKITDEVKAELAKLPTRAEWEKMKGR